MIKIRASAFILVSTLAFVGLYMLEKKKDATFSQNVDFSDLEAFRKAAETRLREPDSWLSVVGLSWLKEGANSIGSDPISNSVILPHPAPKHMGIIYQKTKSKKPKFEIEFSTNQIAGAQPPTEFSTIQIDGHPVQIKKRYPLSTDKSGKPSLVSLGPVTFLLIERKNGVGIRVRNTQSEALLQFKGRSWYPPKKDFIIQAEWVAHDKPRMLHVPDVIGNLNEELSPGFVRFELDGEKVELHPIQDADELFFVFRDQTSGKETYGASRFLYAKTPQNGRVTLDFNRAINPPCAFTRYATCPMPPEQNVLKVAIRAGELKPIESH